MTLVSGTDYSYPYVITTDAAAIGTVLADFSVPGTDLALNTSTNVNPTNEATKAPYTDTTADAQPGAPDMTAATDTGTSSTDNITNVTTPNFTISCVSGSTVNLYDGVTLLGSGTCVAGTVMVSSSALAEGTHNITAQQVDSAGNTSVSSAPTLVIIIDTTAPATPASAPDLQAASDTGTSSTDNITTTTLPTFDVVCAAATNLITLMIDAVPNGLHTCTTAGIESVTATTTLLDAVHTVLYTETDAAGNTSTNSASLSITTDTTNPAAPSAPDLIAASDTGTSTTDNITSDTTPTFNLTCEANATVNLYNGVTLVATGTCTGGNTVSLTASPALSDGTYNLFSNQTDPAGNTGINSAPLLVTIIDTVAPTNPVGAPDLQSGSDSGTSTTDNITSTVLPTFDVTCAAATNIITLMVDSVANGTHICSAAATESVSASTVIADGVHSMTYTETDSAGNVS